MKTMTCFGYYHRNLKLCDRTADQEHAQAQLKSKVTPIDWDFRRFIDNCNGLLK